MYQQQNPTYKQAFYKLHHEFDGLITPEKAEKITTMYQTLDKMIQSDAYNKEYTSESLTGYYFQDYQMIKVYFYDPVKESALYSGKMQDIVKQAKDNKSKLKNNSYTYRYNNYIDHSYANRSTSYFFNFIGWRYLFDYQFSDALIILLLACFILPTYIKEKKSMMNEILDTTENGKKKTFEVKLISIIVISFILVSLFAIMNLILTNSFIGIAGSGTPIYSLHEFSLTPYSCSIMTFYILCLMCEILGFSVLGCLFLLITKYVKEYLFAFIISFSFIVILLFINGYIGTFSNLLRIISLCSPFHLMNFPSISQNITGYNIFGHFISTSFSAIIVQMFLFIIIAILVLIRKKGIYHVKLGIKKNSF